MDAKLISGILNKIEDGTVSNADLSDLNAQMNQVLSNKKDLPFDELLIETQLWNRIDAERKGTRRFKIRKRVIEYSIAAVVVLCFTVAVLYRTNFHLAGSPSVEVIKDREPYGSFLSISLPSGKKALSTSVQQMEDVGFEILNDSSGIQTLALLSNGKADTSDYRILSTSAGGLFRIKLQEGTFIHLNANTVVKIPTKFSAHQRAVELIEGEAFFDVVHHTSWPFKVKVGKADIEDLGTSFLLSTRGRNTTTSLISGLLKIRNGKKSLELRPGQGVNVNDNVIGNPYLFSENLNTDWMEGVFRFDNEPLEKVMQRVSQWYGVRIIWENKALGDRNFVGIIDRRKPLSKVLELITLTSEMSFQLDNNILKIK